MLHVYYGGDTKAVRATVMDAVAEYQQNGYDVFRLEADRYEAGKLADLCEGVSLFGTPSVYVLDTPSQASVFWDEVITYHTTLHHSPHPFLVIEGALTAAQRKQFGSEVTLQTVAGETATRFNTFTLAEALARRDRRGLWLGYQQARVAGVAAEEVIGILWWQLKMLRLAQLTSTAAEAGVKEYPYKKAKQAAAKFAEGEVQEQMRTLLAVYHDGHGGVRDLDIALERWILGK